MSKHWAGWLLCFVVSVVLASLLLGLSWKDVRCFLGDSFACGAMIALLVLLGGFKNGGPGENGLM